MDRRWDTSPSSDVGQRPWSPGKLPREEVGDCSRRSNDSKRKRVLGLDEDVDEIEPRPSQAGSGESGEEEAKPIGDVVRVSFSGEEQFNHFNAFEFAGGRYELEDPVLGSPESFTQNLSVVIIRDITKNIGNGELLIIGQCLYRPWEAWKRGGGTWKEVDSRELFYSFDQEKIYAHSVMHKCVMNFVPLHKQLPHRRQFPGFIVQKLYNAEREEVFDLSDTEGTEECSRLETHILFEETAKRIGDLPNLSMEDTSPLRVEHDTSQTRRAWENKPLVPYYRRKK